MWILTLKALNGLGPELQSFEIYGLCPNWLDQMGHSRRIFELLSSNYWLLFPKEECNKISAILKYLLHVGLLARGGAFESRDSFIGIVPMLHNATSGTKSEVM